MKDIPIVKYLKKLGISYHAAYNAVKRFSETGKNSDRERIGRPKKTTAKEDRKIVMTSKRNRRLTAPEIAADINCGRLEKISVSTVKRRLLDAGFRGCIAVKKPLLRPTNKQKRLQWARLHENWTVSDWEKVLWSDESKFDLFGTKRRIYVRRQPGERFRNECLVPTVKHGGGSILVWGCFAGGKVGNLKRIDGIMKKEDYHQILQRHAIPSGNTLVGQGFWFQEDNDPKHSSNLCRNYLNVKEKQGMPFKNS